MGTSSWFCLQVFFVLGLLLVVWFCFSFARLLALESHPRVPQGYVVVVRDPQTGEILLGDLRQAQSQFWESRNFPAGEPFEFSPWVLQRMGMGQR